MNKYILNRASKYSGDLIHYTDILKVMDQSPPPYYSYFDKKKYFFLKSELDPENGIRRHCIPLRTKFFDYISKKEYPTLNAWAEDNGRSIQDVCYGRVDMEYNHKYPWITIEKLVKFLNPKKWEA